MRGGIGGRNFDPAQTPNASNTQVTEKEEEKDLGESEADSSSYLNSNYLKAQNAPR